MYLRIGVILNSHAAGGLYGSLAILASFAIFSGSRLTSRNNEKLTFFLTGVDGSLGGAALLFGVL